MPTFQARRVPGALPVIQRLAAALGSHESTVIKGSIERSRGRAREEEQIDGVQRGWSMDSKRHPTAKGDSSYLCLLQHVLRKPTRLRLNRFPLRLLLLLHHFHAPRTCSSPHVHQAGPDVLVFSIWLLGSLCSCRHFLAPQPCSVASAHHVLGLAPGGRLQNSIPGEKTGGKLLLAADSGFSLSFV